MASLMFGWELNYRLVENDIVRKEDILVALIHWYFIKYGLRCIGLGDSKTLSPSDVGNETLPRGWNANENYTLRYVHKKELFILKGVRTEADIVFNLLRVSDVSVSIIHFKIEDTVKALKGSIETLIPTYKEVINTIQKDLLEPVVLGNNKEATTQTAQPATTDRQQSRPSFEDDYDDPLRIGRPRRPIGVDVDPEWDPNRDPSSVGRSDLNPFSRGGGMLFNPFGPRGGISNPRGLPRDPNRDPSSVGRSDLNPFSRGGGMLFNPFGPRGGISNPRGLPRGSLPPGARFDPIYPPNVGPGRGSRGGGPDPDHLPPPGYDDMFM